MMVKQHSKMKARLVGILIIFIIPIAIGGVFGWYFPQHRLSKVECK
jgi:hypothetical protein